MDMPLPAELPPVVRQGTSWKPSVMLGCVAFVLMVLGFQLLGGIQSYTHREKISPVTVVVEQYPAVFSHGVTKVSDIEPMVGKIVNKNHRLTASSKTLEHLKAQVTAPDLLRQVWADLSRKAEFQNRFESRDVATEMEQFRQALQVEVEESPLGGKGLRLTLAWPNSAEAAELLKILGDRYSKQYQAMWANRYECEYNDAKNAAHEARQTYDDALAQLESFEEYDEYLAWQPETEESLAKGSDGKKIENAVKPSIGSSNNANVENPEWTRLNKELAALHERESQLLEKRTPLHPEVKYLQDEIQNCETQLAAIPQWIAAENSLPHPVSTESNNQPIQSSTVQKLSADGDASFKNAKFLAQLDNQVQSTARAYRDAVAREQMAFGQRQLMPDIAVHVMEPRKTASITPLQRPIAWLAGMMMAFGMGLIYTGKSREPPVGSLVELQRLAAVPIVGVVPSYTSAVDPRTLRRKKILLRWELFLGGLMLMGVCLWATVRLL
jgi:hypothetical protein